MGLFGRAPCAEQSSSAGSCAAIPARVSTSAQSPPRRRNMVEQHDAREALEPCPFCGGVATEKHSHNHNAATCGTCRASVPQSGLGHGDAGTRWNRRATPPAAPAPEAPADLPARISEEMHVAAVKVLHRATGVAGLPQRMLDAMRAVATQPTKPAQAEGGNQPEGGKPSLPLLPVALTDEQHRAIWERESGDWINARNDNPYLAYGKGVERAHGITQQKGDV